MNLSLLYRRRRIASIWLLLAVTTFSLASTSPLTPLVPVNDEKVDPSPITGAITGATTQSTNQPEEQSHPTTITETQTSNGLVLSTISKERHPSLASISSEFSSRVTVPESSAPLITATQPTDRAMTTEEKDVSAANQSSTSSSEEEEARVDVFKNHFRHVGNLLYITVTTLISSLLVLGYHHMHKVTLYLPESCFLLCIGILAGVVIRYTKLDSLVPETFSPDTFFLVLLPPIILGASYSLNNRIFYENLGVVLLFAVLGTAAACFLIAPFLYALSHTAALNLPANNLFKQIFVFSAFVVAVDPVAVLAVFSELGVNKPLHIVVFGESLLNDGVSVVLYRVMININKMTEVTGDNIGMAFLKFLVCVVVSCLIGCTGGLFATFVCKYSYSRHIMEPVILVSTAYISYLLAESLDLSGIIGMIACGLVQAQYAFHNINSKSRTNTKFIIKVISTSAELVIFIFLGIAIVRTRHQWNAGFIVWSLVACIVSRVIVTFLFSFFVNKFHGERMKIFSFEEQIIMAYSGLRGGVAFSLSLQLNEKDVPLRGTFITTVLIIILFNVVIQGITIRPLVNFLKVKLEEKSKKNLMITINSKMIDEILELTEKIIGRHSGHNMWRKRAENFELNHIQCYLLKSPHPSESKIESVHQKVSMRAMQDFLISLHSPMPAGHSDMRRMLSLTRNSVLFMPELAYGDSSASTLFPSIQELNTARFSHLIQNDRPQNPHTQGYLQNYAAENAAFEGTETEDHNADAGHGNSIQINSTNQRKLSKTSGQKELKELTNQEEKDKATSATRL